MSYRLSSVQSLLAFVITALCCSMPAYAFLSFPLTTTDSSTGDTSTDSAMNLGSLSRVGVYFETCPLNPNFSCAPNVTINCIEADGESCGDITGVAAYTGTWVFTHHNSKTKPDTAECLADNCLASFAATLDGGVQAKVQFTNSDFDGLYTIANIDGNTITLADQLATKTNGTFTNNNVTGAMATVYLTIVNTESTVYGRVYNDPPDNSPESPTVGVCPIETCTTQDLVGTLSYETVADRECSKDPDTGLRALPCSYSASVLRGQRQTGSVQATSANNVDLCYDFGNSTFVPCTTCLGDPDKLNKPTIDLIYPEDSVFARGEYFKFTVSNTLGISGISQRGVNNLPVQGVVDCGLASFDTTFLASTSALPAYDVGLDVNPGQINASSGSNDLKISVIPPEEVQATTIVPNSLRLAFRSSTRAATVFTLADPDCNYTTATCLHMKFSRLGTICAAAYVEPDWILDAGQEICLPLRGDIDDPTTATSPDGVIRHPGSLSCTTVAMGEEFDFNLNYELCNDPNLNVTYEPEL